MKWVVPFHTLFKVGWERRRGALGRGVEQIDTKLIQMAVGATCRNGELRLQDKLVECFLAASSLYWPQTYPSSSTNLPVFVAFSPLSKCSWSVNEVGFRRNEYLRGEPLCLPLG